MIKIHFIGNLRNCYNRHYHPIRAFKKQLLINGIKTRFFPSPIIPGIKDCDVLVMFSDGYRDILPLEDKSKQAGYQYLAEFFNEFDRVVWFDDHDSSGMVEPGIFPLVDVYAKAQILKDKSYYLKSHRVGSPHRDYVSEQYGIDDRQNLSTAITQDDLSKLRLGWNLSLINWSYSFADSKCKKVRGLIRPGKNIFNITSPELSTRSQQVIFRGRMWENEPTVGWWREETVKQIKAINDRQSLLTPNPKKIISRKEYQEEMRRSIICPSPFGKGEICYRDMETLIAGSVLFKPDMSHITTWPNIYNDNETYVAHSWDFSDYGLRLEEIINLPDKYNEQARYARNLLFSAITNESEFLIQFFHLIN